MWRQVLWASVAMSVVLAAAGADDKITKETIMSGGRQRTYHLYVPPGAGAEPLPLVVLLHGSGRRGDSLIDPWKSLAKREKVVLVAPDSLNSAVWMTPDDGPDFVYDVVEAVKKAQRIDPRAVYLFGHSAGAVFGLSLGLLESRYFAAVAVHAGAFRSPGEFVYVAQAKRKIPFAVWVGNEDRFFPLAAVRATRDAFAAEGLPFELTEIRNHDHNYYVRADEINKQAWAFMKAHVLGTEPEFERYQFGR
jgi:poly(3-hydroxybutyrate) depolymerase